MRKTQSQPRSKSTKLPTATHFRKQDLPATSNFFAGTNDVGDPLDSQSDKSRPGSKLGTTGRTAASFGSPKPKRNLFEGFKQTLKPGKGKGSDNWNSRSKDKSCGSGGSLNSPVTDEQPFSDMAPGSSLCSSNTSNSNSEDYSPVRIS